MLIPMKLSIHTDYYSFLCVKKGLDCCFLTNVNWFLLHCNYKKNIQFLLFIIKFYVGLISKQ